MRIAIIGTGYVGLVTGACLSDVGHDVVCVDLDPEKVRAIEQGEAFLYEPGLQDILDRRAGENLRGTTDLRAAVQGSELTMLAVGTPSVDGAIDLGQVASAAEAVGEALADGSEPHVVVVKSTVVPGSTEDRVGPILERASGRRIGTDLGLAMNPEFLREGNAVDDFASPDRIVLGVADALAEDALRRLYAPYEGVDVLVTTPRTAEMIKYTANSLLATLISFSNEMGNLAARLPGVDIAEVMEGVYLDRRLSPVLPSGERIRPGILSYLAAGCGFGGSCFPKDVQALRSFARSVGSGTNVLDAVLDVNSSQPAEVVKLLEKELGDLAGLRIAVLGLSFKPDTDDVRESPSLVAIRLLDQTGADVVAYDPVAAETARAALNGEARMVASVDDAIADAEAVVIMTSWAEFRDLPQKLATRTDPPLVVEGRRMFVDGELVRRAAIGLGPAREPAAT